MTNALEKHHHKNNDYAKAKGRFQAYCSYKHPSSFGSKLIPIQWGAAESIKRGPIIAKLTKQAHCNVIGTHSGSYAIYRALEVASGALKSALRSDLGVFLPPIGGVTVFGFGNMQMFDWGLAPVPTNVITKVFVHKAED